MSNANQETIADIVAALRAVAYIQTAESPRDVLEFADRIEAAAKREREAGAVLLLREQVSCNNEGWKQPLECVMHGLFV